MTLRNHQWKQKIPISLLFITVGVGVITVGILNHKPRWRSSWMPSETVFMGIFSIAWAVIFFFFGTIDWSTWNHIKRQFANKQQEPPIEVGEPTESDEKGELDGFPTTLLGWGSALIAACALTWFFVSFVAEFVAALLR